MEQDIKQIINAARHRVLLSDPEIAKVIKDVRGEKMGDKDVYEHVNKILDAKTRMAILEAGGSDTDDLDFGDFDDDFGDFDLDEPSSSNKGKDDAGDDSFDTRDDNDDDEYPDDEDGEENGNNDDMGFGAGKEEIDAFSAQGSFAEDAEAISRAVRGLKDKDTGKATKASVLINTVGRTFGLTRVDYLDTIDALYKEAIDTGTHRETFNLLTFIKFIGIKDITAAFAFMDIPNTDLSEVFSDMALNEKTYIVVDGCFYKSTFNNDSILNWPWRNLRPSIDVFKGCPFNNLDINRVAGRKILQIAGIDSAREAEIRDVSAKANSAITAANTSLSEND